MKRVNGVLFVDYVRMIRSRKDISWSRHLLPEDMAYLTQRIEPSQWYPMEVFERFGLAILEEVAGNDLHLVRQWGRETIDSLHETQPEVFVAGDARETFMRFQILRQSLFDFPGARVTTIRDGDARLELNYEMSPRAEQAAAHQSLGFLERLVELTGAKDIEVALRTRSWEGDPTTTIVLHWK